MHDWTRLDDGIYHDFYLSWVAAISAGLNQGKLPSDYYALVERHTMDVAEWERGVPDGEFPARPPVHDQPGIFDLNEIPPSTPIKDRCEELAYWRKVRSVTVRSSEDNVAVAVVEVVTPAIKRVPVARQRFLGQMARAMYRGIHLLLVDPFVRCEEKRSLAGDL
jgi:hypothetical protein